MNVNPATETLYIVNPLSGKGTTALFSTHPPLEERIARLREYDRNRGHRLGRTRTPRQRRRTQVRWRGRRTPSTRISTSSSRGPSATCPSASGRSTSTGSTRTSASSSRSSSRSCSRGTCRRVGACSTRLPGSGTTLVQSLESGHPAVGVDVAAFNCLLVGVKTARYNEFVLESEIRDALSRLDTSRCQAPDRGYIGQWFAPQAAAELLAFRSLIGDYEHADVLRVVLARAARSARLTTHFDLDFPKEPQAGPYWCFKHKRECRPVERAEHFVRRYALDTLARIKAFARVRDRTAEAAILHGDARELPLDGPLRRRRHLAAVPRADRLPRAAPLRLRAPWPRRPPRARGRRRGGRNEQGRDRRVLAGHGRGARQRSRLAPPRRAGRDRRQRPPRPLPGDPRSRGPPARAPPAPPREPPHRPPRRRVLRRRARRPRLTLGRVGSPPEQAGEPGRERDDTEERDAPTDRRAAPVALVLDDAVDHHCERVERPEPTTAAITAEVR